MPSLDYETEKNEFREYYGSSSRLLEDAKNSFATLLNALVIHAGNIPISKIEGRVKEKEECIKKFNLKYRPSLEASGQIYSILEHISDLIGLRVVCLYEDDIDKIYSVLAEHFDVIDVTNKIAQVENTEGSFGYKGLHLDLKLSETRNVLPEYLPYARFPFEVQIRTIIQDSWSVLDHKIKYKKSIPIGLKRRINTLAALFELADREFRQIRESTDDELNKTDVEPDAVDLTEPTPTTDIQISTPLRTPVKLDAFNFLRIARHFFPDYEFEPHKVDGFTQEIAEIERGITRGKFNFYLKDTIGRVKRYQLFFDDQAGADKLNPFTVIRHCLYLADKELFKSMLTNIARDSFDVWLLKNPA